MKRILTLCLVLVSIATFAGATIKVETETWFDANTLQYSEYSPTYNSSFFNPGGQFFLGRAYLTISGDLGTDYWGDPIKERVTFDFANASTNNPAGIIKYAYFDYDLLRISYDSVDATGQSNTTKLGAIVFDCGLQPVYFGNIAFWNYALPIKDATELYTKVQYPGDNPGNGMLSSTNYTGVKPTASADFGFGLSGKLLPIPNMTSYLIFYSLQMLDGDGYTRYFNNNGFPENNPVGQTNDNNFAYQASAWLCPLDGTMIGGTYRVYSYDDNAIGGKINNTETSFDVTLSAKNVMGIPVDFLVQYINETSTNNWAAPNNGSVSAAAYDYIGDVFSVSLGYGFFDWAVEPMIRYDYFNPNASQSVADVSSSILYVGGSIKLDANNLTMKPMVGFYLTQNGQPSSDWLVWLEFAYKLNFTIWQ
jgi:hypothetical protein